MATIRDTRIEEANDFAVGLLGAQLSYSRRKLLDVINGLYSAGIQFDVDLPTIAVIGSQSVGKSSLIESISGISLPRASGTCTRCPIECRLTSSSEPWECVVSLRFFRNDKGMGMPATAREIQFGSPIYDRRHVEERIRKAQLAILNPSQSPEQFLRDGYIQDRLIDAASSELRFSSDCVCLKIRGSGLSDLSFVDLPGLISSVDDEGNLSDINSVRNMISDYIAKPTCLILLTVACETEYVNQGAAQLAKAHDPEGKRTIGVLTKPDRIPRSEESKWLRLIRNESHPLLHGWYCVKHPDSIELASQLGWAEARSRGEAFFVQTEPWASMGFPYRQKLGTAKLTQKLSDLLYEAIKNRLPMLLEDLERLIRLSRRRIVELPPQTRTKDSTKEVLYVITEFLRDITLNFQGRVSAHPLASITRTAFEEFKSRVRRTAPDFRLYENKVGASERLLPAFLIQEGWEVTLADDGRTYTLQEIVERRKAALTWELPGATPFAVSRELIREVIDLWRTPALDMLSRVESSLDRYLQVLCDRHLDERLHGGLRSVIMSIITKRVVACREHAMSHLIWLLEIEKQPFTAANRELGGYKEKFYNFYKSIRLNEPSRKEKERDLITYTDALVPRNRPISFLDDPPISQGFEANRETALVPVDWEDIDAGLHIMAEVRAYFQVAHQRFIDNMCCAVNHDLILGFECNLYSDLREWIARQPLSELIQVEVVIKDDPLRSELEAQCRKLEAALQDLRNV